MKSPRHAVAPSIVIGLIATWGSVSRAAAPTPTPTVRPRLSGGFGRTPVAPAQRGQTYADVVRAASESKARKEQKAGVAITNQTLVTDPKKGKLTTSAPRNVVAAAATAAPAATPVGGGEAEWRARARAARSRVEEAASRVAQLEQETKKLENDFYAWDDGQYRDGVIKPAWDRKREELAAARRELEDAQKSLAELPEAARKAGAQPGWIRE